MAQFVDRVAQLPRLLQALWYHPEGMRIDDLAAEFGVTPDNVRETLLAYYRADLAEYDSDLLYRADVLEFFGGSEDSELVSEAPMVRLVAADPTQEIGVSYTTVAELARLYRAGRDRLQLEPDNEVLASAVDKLAAGLLPAVQPSAPHRPVTRPPQFRKAVVERRKVRITYARAWRPGVTERVIEPYQMVRTRRGWEIDAGPVQDNGRLRTFLLTGVQHFNVLADTFDTPENLTVLLEQQRHLTPVELTIPYDARWAVEKYAEKVETVSEDETMITVRAQLLEPVEERVGLIMLAAGPGAASGTERTREATRRLATALLTHHRA
jgi:proteasome accessory factor C